MNVEIQKFIDEQKELYKSIKKIDNLMDIYKQVEGIDIPDISKYTEQKNVFNRRIKSIDTLVDAYQSLCNHTHSNGSDAMMYMAHDSHKEYYECALCGKEESV